MHNVADGAVASALCTVDIRLDSPFPSLVWSDQTKSKVRATVPSSPRAAPPTGSAVPYGRPGMGTYEVYNASEPHRSTLKLDHCLPEVVLETAVGDAPTAAARRSRDSATGTRAREAAMVPAAVVWVAAVVLRPRFCRSGTFHV